MAPVEVVTCTRKIAYRRKKKERKKKNPTKQQQQKTKLAYKTLNFPY